MASTKQKKKFSKIMLLHYWKFFYRSLLFITATVVYIINRVNNTGFLFGGYEEKPLLLAVIWCIYVIEMLLRFLPSSFESMGCQKQFSKNYRPPKKDEQCPRLLPWPRVLSVVIFWVLLNGLIGYLYHIRLFDAGILILISLAYAVCDMICILFFCPFQTWFMKNRCCTTCRIYNWDFAMMFTPLTFIDNIFSQTLVLISILLLIRWEYALYRHPQWFSETTNQSLSCAMCQEKLCHHKTQLKGFWKSQKERLF
ncbi:MAG: hypothetical protein U0L05_07530 [Schaedlerella sp.]|nr:hypothetical protein [Schaedlerella sp.]